MQRQFSHRLQPKRKVSILFSASTRTNTVKSHRSILSLTPPISVQSGSTIAYPKFAGQSQKYRQKSQRTTKLTNLSSLFSTSTTMADDASYATFLTRANQDPKSGHSEEVSSTSQARSKFDPSSTSSSSTAVPEPLRDISATFTSETDSDFEPIFFSYASHKLPDKDEFVKVLGIKGENAGRVEILSVEDWDPKGNYADVVDKVRRAGSETGGKDKKGQVNVYRLEVDETGTRIEYYVLSVGDRSLVGVVAKAVES